MPEAMFKSFSDALAEPDVMLRVWREGSGYFEARRS